MADDFEQKQCIYREAEAAGIKLPASPFSARLRYNNLLGDPKHYRLGFNLYFDGRPGNNLDVDKTESKTVDGTDTVTSYNLHLKTDSEEKSSIQAPTVTGPIEVHSERVGGRVVRGQGGVVKQGTVASTVDKLIKCVTPSGI